MHRELVCVLTAGLALQIIGASTLMCPSDPNCVCGGTLAVELNCNIDGRIVKINLLPNTYLNIKCENSTSLDYNKLPKCANDINSFKSVSFKDCPIPTSSFKDVLTSLGVTKTMALIFQNAKNLSGYFDRKHFAGLQDLTKLLLSVNGITRLPDNLFTDINKLTWLNIRSNSINLTEELFKPLERLETLEISHNHMTNISSNLFSHLTLLRKLSLWQSNVTWFSEDFFTGVDVLEELDLSSNGLNELPWSIFKPLKKLRKLTLLSNKFSTLPENLFRYNNELETVVILNNDVKLKTLPRYFFGNLRNLKQIYIQRCGLEYMPYDVFSDSSNITNISLSYNEIKVLPEPAFNDQINLLELDLSHNNLTQLGERIFSSLVRLERLDLSYNSIVEIPRSTFSPLLSLIYLNMEHNGLKILPNYLFVYNKQKMSITLAYNRLSFEVQEEDVMPGVLHRLSPFSGARNLRLLNLSHNEFNQFFYDWWLNGVDVLDIRYNNITNLLDEVEPYKPAGEMWIAHNPLKCECKNFHFIDFVTGLSTKIPDLSTFQCSIWTKVSCYTRYTIFIIIIIILVSLYLVMIVLFIFYRKNIKLAIKRKLWKSKNKNSKPARKVKTGIMVNFCENDEEFILKDFVPQLKSQNFNLFIHPVQNEIPIYVRKSGRRVKDICTRKDDGALKYDTTLVVFSPNYLMTAYKNVDIKKIHGEMLKAKDTIYIFVDIGPENSIYAFLKDQRDINTSVLWSDVDFWKKIIDMLSVDHDLGVVSAAEKDDIKTPVKLKISKAKCPRNISFSKLPDWSTQYNVNPIAHSHV
ncbi:protein toll [Amyelois transitella]|uniref:protein toll n=1 Tax=Amyelois transitella TaxID=680683 RepID=UPI00299051F1|nr:protein toll [Amyelois transitella]